MDSIRASVDVDPGAAFRRARFRRWFGRYFLLAVLVFALGAVLGAAVVATTDLSGLRDLLGGIESALPDRITFWTVAKNNLIAVGVTALGLVSFGAIAVVSLLLNGFVLGVVVAGAASEGEFLTALALILPHGVVELGAFWLVAGLSFRVTHRFVDYLRGRDETAITRQELFEVVVLLGVAAVAILVAAWIEAVLTVEIARALVGPL